MWDEWNRPYWDLTFTQIHGESNDESKDGKANARCNFHNVTTSMTGSLFTWMKQSMVCTTKQEWIITTKTSQHCRPWSQRRPLLQRFIIQWFWMPVWYHHHMAEISEGGSCNEGANTIAVYSVGVRLNQEHGSVIVLLCIVLPPCSLAGQQPRSLLTAFSILLPRRKFAVLSLQNLF